MLSLLFFPAFLYHYLREYLYPAPVEDETEDVLSDDSGVEDSGTPYRIKNLGSPTKSPTLSMSPAPIESTSPEQCTPLSPTTQRQHVPSQETENTEVMRSLSTDEVTSSSYLTPLEDWLLDESVQMMQDDVQMMQSDVQMINEDVEMIEDDVEMIEDVQIVAREVGLVQSEAPPAVSDPAVVTKGEEIHSNFAEVDNKQQADRQTRIIVALSESDDSDIEEFLSQVISIEPTSDVVASHPSDSNSDPSVPLSVPSSGPFSSLASSGSPGESNACLPVSELAYPVSSAPSNAHVEIVDNLPDSVIPPVTMTRTPSATAPPAAFSPPTKQPSNVAPEDDYSDSSSDIELPGYQSLLLQDVSSVKPPIESRNGATAVHRTEEPSPTEFRTSSKDAPIKKYVPKVPQKRKKSDDEWNQYMGKCMLSGARAKIITSMKQCFLEAFDAYQLCCELLVTFGVTHASGRTVFQRAALEEIGLWKVNNVAPRPSLSNQRKALDVSYLCNSTLFAAIRQVYELDGMPAEEAVIFVHDKLDHKRTKYLKHMAFIISELKLQQYFDTPAMLLPLLAMDKLMTIEAYLADKKIATTFVRSLDCLLEPTGAKVASLVDQLEREYEYEQSTAQFKFNADQITTLVKRLLKLHGLEGDAAPNLAQTKTIHNLKSILFCKYRKGATEDWTSTLVSTVRESEILQHVLFDELERYNDIAYAVYLYQRIQPNHAILPQQLRDHIENSYIPPPSHPVSNTVEEEEEEEEDEEEEEEEAMEIEISVRHDAPIAPIPNMGFAALPPSVSVVDVASVSSLSACQDALRCARLIAFDSEWRAILDPTKPCPVALVQLAANNRCFLLDVAALLDRISEADLISFAETVFREDVTIVGYALAQDYKKLLQTIPAMGEKLGTHPNVVDLAIPHKHLMRVDRMKRSAEIRRAISAGAPLPDPGPISQHTGLSRLSEMVLSLPMDKTCQVSDWTRRPLNPDQRSYAALDAHILLYLHDRLSEQFHPTPLAELSQEIPEEHRGVSYLAPSAEPTPAHSLRVVVDVMCQGLGKKLRHIGVDCAILEDNQTVDDAARLALSEGRVILSRDSNCQRLVRLTDPGRVYCVKAMKATDQLLEIRKHFNLVVEDDDLFSRCAICNSSYFVKLEPGQARALKISQEQFNSSTVDCEYKVYERRSIFNEKIHVSTEGVTQYGVRLQLDKVSMNKFNETQMFWGCYDCGKMYWDGCHLKNFKSKHNL